MIAVFLSFCILKNFPSHLLKMIISPPLLFRLLILPASFHSLADDHAYFSEKNIYIFLHSPIKSAFLLAFFVYLVKWNEKSLWLSGAKSFTCVLDSVSFHLLWILGLHFSLLSCVRSFSNSINHLLSAERVVESSVSTTGSLY